MKLKYIDFTFENCDMIRIDGEHIGGFLIDDISTTIERIGCNSIEKMDVAKTVAIEILKPANKERYEFAQSHIENFKQMTFDRFRVYGDITNIQFELAEDVGKEIQAPYTQNYNYYVDWTGDNEYVNESQKTCLSDDGNLYIVIADGKSIEDFF